MPAIHCRPRWAVAEHVATPEDVFANRRTILKGLGLGMGAIAGAGLLPGMARARRG